MNLVPFFVCEDKRAWACWNIFFDIHLNYLGQYSAFLHSDTLLGAAAVVDGLMAELYFAYQNYIQHSLSTDV